MASDRSNASSEIASWSRERLECFVINLWQIYDAEEWDADTHQAVSDLLTDFGIPPSEPEE